MNRIPLTVAGAEQLRAELERLKTVERPRIARALAEARGHGDISENAEYHAAKDEQGFIEGRIASLEATLARAHIIDPSTLDGNAHVMFGATVTLCDLQDDAEVCYQIVGEIEADIKAGRIAVTSPIARALIGREPGEVVEVQAPSGVRRYAILAVRYV